MKCLSNVRFKNLKDIDIFGKEPELYYKGKTKKTSWIGMIFSVLLLVIYFSFFLYKIIRMLKRTDITFYDTFTYADEPPSIRITNENFYGGFALKDPQTYDAFIDEGVYIPKAFFKRAERKGENFVWQIKEIELEPCKLEKFGSMYQDIFKSKTINNSYCFKEMDFVLEGHFSYDLYSFFSIQFFPCVNTTEKKNCKPLEIIDYYLKNTFVSFQLQDIELTPNNYETPFHPRNVDVYTTVGKKLFQEIHAFFQIVNIQTDMDWIGLDEFENIKSELYLKYDKMIAMSNIAENDIYETGQSFCDFKIKLSENIRTEKRTYTKLITILADVGGLMEVIFTLFKIISSFTIDILYDISLVNNLFDFDLDKKVVILKDKKSSKKNIYLKYQNDGGPTIYCSSRRINSQKTININEEMNTETENRFNEEKKNKPQNENYFGMRYIRRISGLKSKTNYFPDNKNNKNNFNDSESKNKNLLISKKKNIKIDNHINYNDANILTNNSDNSEENERRKGNIISQIKVNKACLYLCFCCIRRRKTIHNFLLDEGMNIISEKIDIFNIFDKMYKDEEIREKVLLNKIIEMSDDCKLKLKSLRKRF
jgi:hypothetical protein